MNLLVKRSCLLEYWKVAALESEVKQYCYCCVAVVELKSCCYHFLEMMTLLRPNHENENI